MYGAKRRSRDLPLLQEIAREAQCSVRGSLLYSRDGHCLKIVYSPHESEQTNPLKEVNVPGTAGFNSHSHGCSKGGTERQTSYLCLDPGSAMPKLNQSRSNGPNYLKVARRTVSDLEL